MSMKKFIFLLISSLVLFGIFGHKAGQEQKSSQIQPAKRIWKIKSVDTMKYSRDLALEKLTDPTFDLVIESQARAVKSTGANYIAIGTPYDERFVPYLARWVSAARRVGLKVWFRGNFSGWEGWFGQKRTLTRQEHLEMVGKFIASHSELFQNGDIFSPCPECENGGPGDPRSETDVGSFKQFMIAEHRESDNQFKKLGKSVATNFASMNYDVASLVMDQQTVAAMGNLIVIDHYVATPKQLATQVDVLAQKTKANIFLGEFGVPIVDINGDLSESDQADWIDQALSLLGKNHSVIGLNYWVLSGGETSIYTIDLSAKKSAGVLQKYYQAPDLDALQRSY